jgi:hypothetical protein
LPVFDKKFYGHPMNEDQGEKMDTQRVCVMILGMHRSGSSVLTRLFGALGCDLPVDALPATAENRLGYWEPRGVRELNDEVLASAGSRWNDLQTFNADWYASPVRGVFVERGRRVLREAFSSSALFALKDPRICRLAPLWFEILAAEGVDPVVVLGLRNPEEVAASLLKRDGFLREEGMLLWLRHMLDAERASRGKPRIVADYTQVLQNWRQVAAASSEVFGFAWPRPHAAASFDLVDYINISDRHNYAVDAQTVTDPTISSWVRQAFTLLLSRDGKPARVDDPQDQARLDTISSEFSMSLDNFAPLLLAGMRNREQLQAKTGALESVEIEVSALRAQLEESRGREATVRELEMQLHKALGDLGLSTAANHQMVERIKGLESQEAVMRENLSRLAETEEALCEARVELEVLSLGMAQETNRNSLAEQLAENRIATLAQRVAALEDDARSAITRAEKAEREAAREASRSSLAVQLAENRVVTLTQQVATLEDDARSAVKRVEKADREVAMAHKRISERTDEIVILTGLLRSAEQSAEIAEWLKAVNRTMTRTPWWWGLMPTGWRRGRIAKRLKQRKLFDSDEYCTIYPDVARSGQSPIDHYINHGVVEGRARPI